MWNRGKKNCRLLSEGCMPAPKTFWDVKIPKELRNVKMWLCPKFKQLVGILTDGKERKQLWRLDWSGDHLIQNENTQSCRVAIAGGSPYCLFEPDYRGQRAAYSEYLQRHDKHGNVLSLEVVPTMLDKCHFVMKTSLCQNTGCRGTV